MNEIKDIHDPFCRWLDKNHIPFHRNRPDKKTTAIKGDPDFLCTLANRCLYVECKVPGGKTSKIQNERIAYLRQAGNTVKLAYSCEEAIAAISEHFGVVNADSGAVVSESGQACEVCNGSGWVYRNCLIHSAGTKRCPRCDGSGEASSVPKVAESEDATRASVTILFLGNVGGKDYVLEGDRRPGGQARLVRTATPADLINIPRK